MISTMGAGTEPRIPSAAEQLLEEAVANAKARTPAEPAEPEPAALAQATSRPAASATPEASIVVALDGSD